MIKKFMQMNRTMVDMKQDQLPICIMVAGTASNAGKTVITTALLHILAQQGYKICAAKVGPDYIDPQFHKSILGIPSLNLDLFAFSEQDLITRFYNHIKNYDICLIEGVMGLCDGAPGLSTSSLAVAKALNCSIILVHNAQSQFQSACLSVSGFIEQMGEQNCASVIFNHVGSDYHGKEICDSFKDQFPSISCAYVKKSKDVILPSRHLGLVQAEEVDDLDQIIDKASQKIQSTININSLLTHKSGADLQKYRQCKIKTIRPLGQKIAIARDKAFNFCYPHFISDWQSQGAELSFFSPLEDEAPAKEVDAIFLPGGYPEIFAAKLASNLKFKAAMHLHAQKGAVIYGECGGYMTLGNVLIDQQGNPHEMLGLLPIVTDISNPKRTLGYRYLEHNSSLGFDKALKGHEFHFAQIKEAPSDLPSLFAAKTAREKPIGHLGHIKENIMGSFAHVIC